jgi:hypothetical protein
MHTSRTEAGLARTSRAAQRTRLGLLFQQGAGYPAGQQLPGDEHHRLAVVGMYAGLAMDVARRQHPDWRQLDALALGLHPLDLHGPVRLGIHRDHVPCR